MEFLFSFSVLLFAILFTYFSFHHLNHKRKLPPSEPQLPPGSRGWPFLGETLEYFTNLRNGVPDKFVSERMNKHSSKVFRTWLIGQPMAILCGVEGNKFLFSNENKLVQAWWPGTIDKIFPKSTHKTTKDDFVRVRRILHSFLKADGLQKYVGTMDEVMKLCLQRDWNGSNREIKVGSAVKKYTFALSCKVFLGIELDSERVEKLVKPTEDIAAGSVSIPINLPGTALNRAIKSSKVMRGQIEEMIKERRVDVSEKRVSPKQDMLSHMLLLSEEGENGNFMSEADIASHIAGLLHAGYDTLNSPLTFIMKYLAELPHVYDEVQKEQMEIAKSKAPKELLNWEDIRKMKYSWNVASEVLRIMPPGVGAFREAITDFTYGGYLIPKGLKLHWVAHMTHKDPKYFPNPEKFDPSRFEGNGPPPYTYVPFGAGPRMCPGNEYARLVILVFIHNVVTNFRWEKLLPNEKVVSDPLPRPTQGLPIRLHPLQP